uniref:Kinesin-like protein KIF14 n=1 Tax=Geotrypetes seraphini TaxID=260995 RepID=A0A6P8NPI1_GEOSA|nr:kinesin-like protein KIF14 [Geotrypetes seraphini]XP_033772564.1 kinesin-like protein KIF14 [Geotrypetes seraphini]XP_033772565.1 kinesin-like protein KIF14 [Geotrypetes seraphini]
MPIYKVPTKHQTNRTGISTLKSPLNIYARSNKLGQQNKPQSSDEKDAQPPLPLDTMTDLNRTYVVSACKKSADSSLSLKQDSMLTLQKRKMIKTDTACNDKESDENTERNVEEQVQRQPILQRRTGMGNIQVPVNKNSQSGLRNPDAAGQLKNETSLTANIISKTYCSTPVQSMESHLIVELKNNLKSKDSCSILKDTDGNGKTCVNGTASSDNKQSQNKVFNSGYSCVRTPVNRVPGVKLHEKCIANRIIGKEILKNPDNISGSLDQQRPLRQGAASKSLKSASACNMLQNIRSSAVSACKNRASNLTATPKKSVSNSFHASRPGRIQDSSVATTTIGLKESKTQVSCINQDPSKSENSVVTVAVRIRPFSNRERSENAYQVVFVNGQEIIVQHPETNQAHNFVYDFSFWSFDKSHSNYASQETVYEKLAVPLLERAFEGYNTCLFAYGQTGSGKSYTMMGFDEEQGIIPRFCEDLFFQISRIDTAQVLHHLEMSYFEVYNEKIHDLLVSKGEDGQKKQPLRVREHPTHGPYVEELSVNVVTSYSDVQSWLELGNKQRATAATGMNDKSSRSHSVFMLLMTQTKTEFVEEEEHDHRITSRINLVDLAGSERCAVSQASGEQLKEGISINKSLLTLGKVISALSEHSQTRRKTFIPYRESVLTWLLKESLGGNSKTAMIATISPADSNIEESLSTLRYAKQAGLIINIAKVNEDMNAKLIRELKAEIEKLKAARRSALNIDSDKYKRSQQEITSLKVKLCQQELEIAEMQRAWKARLEQAEKRKFEETKQLQKAGITFKMDNRLPNLVNLNEDPQLSEMLLYMIKEGETTVGKYKADSSHDIQLTGVLIADDHCIVKNVDGTVSITPLADAKTYVNGKHILESTVLHHGDRVILGGDHYFRFNHPVEVQKGQKPSNGPVLSSDGPKDFDFAKNELLVAQKSQLEAEIEEARLKAKEEMMQGIQIAKEMAKQELSSQRAIYENKIKTLEAELKEEVQKKYVQEINSQKAANKIQELETRTLYLEQEAHVNKKRLEMEALTTRQALEDHTVRHARILEALETEKQKISNEVQTLLQARKKEKNTTSQPTWNSMKLSVMIQEANTISNKLGKHTVFCRHETSDKENVVGPPVQVQVRNTRLGISTFWSLEKFEDKLAAMKELYENDTSSKDDDVFYDPADQWEPDITNTSISSFSRRRSRSLLKNRRISGCLYEIRVHPIQSLQTSHSGGLMNKSSSVTDKSSSVTSDSSEAFLPGICKDLIGSALEMLGRSYTEERSVADSLIAALLTVHTGVSAIFKAYEQQDEDSHENLFVLDRAAQENSVVMTSAFDKLVILIKHWLDRFPQIDGFRKMNEELQQEVKKLGGYLQLLLQGCSSDISSMVTEARDKALQAVERAIRDVGHLATCTGSELHLSEDGVGDTKSLKKQMRFAIYDGMGSGLEYLFDSCLNSVKEMQKDLLRSCSQAEVQKQIKNNAMVLTVFFQDSIAECLKVDMRAQLRKESGYWDPKKMSCLAEELLKLSHCIGQLHQVVLSAMKETLRDCNLLFTLLDNMCISAGHINENISFVNQTPKSLIEVRELNTLTRAFIRSFELKQNLEQPETQDTCLQREELGRKLVATDESIWKMMQPRTLSSVKCSPSEIKWV